MNDIDLERNKAFSFAFENQFNDLENIIARVTVCLAHHDNCTGRYIDFTNNYSIICDCTCHKKIGASCHEKGEKQR